MLLHRFRAIGWRSDRACFALAVLALVTGCATAARQDVSPAPMTLPSIPVAVRLKPYFRELTTVDVVSGTDTLRLLLDTGGGHTLVTPAVALRLGCVPFGRSVGHRMDGEPVEFQWCAGIPMRVGGLSIGDGNVAVFDVASLLPSELPSLDGVLALDVLRGKVLTLDLARDQVIFESAASTEAHVPAMHSLSARIATGDDGSSLTILLAAEATPASIYLLLDSGNLIGTMLSPIAANRLLGGDRRVGETTSMNLTLVGMSSWPTSALIRDINYDGALGASFFREHVLMLDMSTPTLRVFATPEPDRGSARP